MSEFVDNSLILGTLRKIGDYCETLSNQPSSQGEEATSHEKVSVPPTNSTASSSSVKSYKPAVSMLHPLALYLQRKANDSQKVNLGEMLATNLNVVDQLLQTILKPYVEDLSEHKRQEISDSDRLTLVLLLHVCFMECSENQAMKEALINLGCVFLLIKELRNLTRVIETDKFTRQLIQTSSLVISNCLSGKVDLYMRLYPETDIKGTFASYFNYPDPIVRVVCKLTYHQFSYYLHHTMPGSIDCIEDIESFYVRVLLSASKSKDFIAMEKNLVLMVDEILKILQCLCVSESNRQAIMTSPRVHSAISNLLENGGNKEIECALKLVLTLLTEGQESTVKPSMGKGKGKKGKAHTPLHQGVDGRASVRETLLSQNPSITQNLKHVLDNKQVDSTVKDLCSAVLWCLQPTPEDSVPACLLYVECCYKHGYYNECSYWSDYIGQLIPSNIEAKELRDRFLLLKANAKFHLYQRQQVLLRRSERLQTIGKIKQSREPVYENAKEVISILGSLKSRTPSVMEAKSEQYLDYVLMDYIREVNKQPGSKSKGSSANEFYCMLCHKKRPIVRSHIVPEAVLKTVIDKDYMIMMGPSSSSEDYTVQSLHTMTFYMLCNTCDNETLSRDEKEFFQNIIKPVYYGPPSSIPVSQVDDEQPVSAHTKKHDNLPYGEWLYRFCVGMVFRSLALSRGIRSSTNAEDVYQLFRNCRLILDALPSEDSAQPQAQIEPHSPEVKRKIDPVEIREHEIVMFFTPSVSENEKPSNLERALDWTIFQHLSTVSISGTSATIGKKHYFFAVHFGIFTIVAFLEPVPSNLQRFLVNPKGGELTVPANSDRLDLTPPGLMTMYKEHSLKMVGKHLEQDDKLIASVGPKDISLTVLKSDAPIKPGILPQSFSLLPPNFDINRQTNTVTLKEGHRILFHYTCQKAFASHTLFLAIEETEPTKPYVIIHTHLESPQTLQTFGYYVSLPEYAYKDDFDKRYSERMKQIRSKNLDVFKAPAQFFPEAFKRTGLHSFQSILYHLNRSSKCCFDSKCIPGDGCWYCNNKCDLCMENSVPGYTIIEPAALRFCSEECMSFVGRPYAFAPNSSVKVPITKVTISLLLTDKDGASEIECTHLLNFAISFSDETKRIPPTQVTLDVYRVEQGNEIQPGLFFVLFDLISFGESKLRREITGEFFLTDSFRLDRPLPHSSKLHLDDETRVLLNDLLQEAVYKSGHDLESIQFLGLKQTLALSDITDEGLTKELKTDSSEDICGLFD